jgi:nickel-dependent lactate racemase
MLTGKGYKDRVLSDDEIKEICLAVLDPVKNEKLLFIIPDHTRTAPTGLLFREIYRAIVPASDHVDFLIALGTHPPMTEKMILERVGITHEEWHSRYSKARFFNHHWDDPSQLGSAGILSKSEMSEISEGLLEREVNVTVNKMVLKYDRLIIAGPVFPHEVVGFSGGNKYLFPGIAGEEIIHFFHWLGALITNMEIIGKINTPVRRVVDRAADLLQKPVDCLAMVVENGQLAGLFGGESREAWLEAARLSEQLHIIYKDRPFERVLSCAPRMYDDLWTGAKCMYKLEPVVADGGEVIIYAPHITELSVTHGEKIMQIGYHVRDYFLKQWDRFKDFPGGIMAHSTHVKGAGTYIDGVEKPRIQVTLATSIPESVCGKIDLGYRDPASIDPHEWMNRETEGIFYVPKAGEQLFRIKSERSD